MTTPDPRTDLAGYLGLTDDDVSVCRVHARLSFTGMVTSKVGARLIEQDQARDAEPDDGLIGALRLIAERGGANYCELIVDSSPRTCRTDPSKVRDLPYIADQWCDACVAADALDLPALNSLRPAPDDGLHAMLDIDALGGAKMLRETMCVAQGAVLREGHAGAQHHADRIGAIIDVCDQHRPLGLDGKHGTRHCTPTCGCIDKREPEPDDGPIPVTDPKPVEGPPGTVPVTLWLTAQEVSGEGEGWDSAVDKLCDACAAIDLPAPKPPWKSPLDDLPDLTESQCRDAVRIAGEGPDSPVMWAQVGRALIAAGWTPGEEA